jgi:preprotein translocase subunit SecE
VARLPARGSARQIASNPKSGGQGFQFFRDIIAELKRVTWPSREQATRLTILVIIISISVGIILGVLDMLFGRGVKLLL